MVINVNPVAYLLARAVELWFDVAQDVSNLPRDKFLDVLAGAVVVGAVANRRFHTKAANPGADQHIARRLRARVGARWVVWCFLSKAVWIVQF